MEPSKKKRRHPFAKRPSLEIPSRTEFERIANSKAIIDITDLLLRQYPVDAAVESFDELRKRRDKFGVVRLKK